MISFPTLLVPIFALALSLLALLIVQGSSYPSSYPTPPTKKGKGKTEIRLRYMKILN